MRPAESAGETSPTDQLAISGVMLRDILVLPQKTRPDAGVGVFRGADEDLKFEI